MGLDKLGIISAIFTNKTILVTSCLLIFSPLRQYPSESVNRKKRKELNPFWKGV